MEFPAPLTWELSFTKTADTAVFLLLLWRQSGSLCALHSGTPAHSLILSWKLASLDHQHGFFCIYVLRGELAVKLQTHPQDL